MMTPDRITTPELYLEIAKLVARRGTCGRLQVGCVITQENRIVSTGYNGVLKNEHHCQEMLCDLTKSCNRAVHAEANAIYFAANMGISLKGATIYCTHSPCIDCVEAIVQSGIKRVVFEEMFREQEPLNRLIANHIIVCQGKEENPVFA